MNRTLSRLDPVRSRSLASFIVLGVTLLACSGDVPPGGVQPIKVGAVFDLTGLTADIGTPWSEGVRGYIEWLNREGGIAGRPVGWVAACRVEVISFLTQ